MLPPGRVQHYSFPMEKEKGIKILHPDFDIIMHNGAHLVPGKVGNAIQVGDGHYLTLGDQRSNCMGDLSRCTHGLTAGFLFKPSERPTQNGYILSSGGYSFFYKDGRVGWASCWGGDHRRDWCNFVNLSLQLECRHGIIIIIVHLYGTNCMVSEAPWFLNLIRFSKVSFLLSFSLIPRNMMKN